MKIGGLFILLTGLIVAVFVLKSLDEGADQIPQSEETLEDSAIIVPTESRSQGGRRGSFN